MAQVMTRKKEKADYRWLSEQETEIWRKVVAATMLTAPLLEADLQKAGSLSFFEFQVLSSLKDADGELTMSQLAERCNCSLSRLSHVARKLEERGAINRSQATNDKRVTMALLTEQGKADVTRVEGRYAESIRRRVLDSLTPEGMEAMETLAEALLANIDPSHWLIAEDDDL